MGRTVILGRMTLRVAGADRGLETDSRRSKGCRKEERVYTEDSEDTEITEEEEFEDL
jgi:hypothetical protein